MLFGETKPPSWADVYPAGITVVHPTAVMCDSTYDVRRYEYLVQPEPGDWSKFDYNRPWGYSWNQL